MTLLLFGTEGNNDKHSIWKRFLVKESKQEVIKDDPIGYKRQKKYVGVHVHLNRKAPITTAADDIHNIFSLFFRGNKT